MTTLWDWYWGIPVVTRLFITSCIITTVAVELGLITWFHLYFNPYLIVERNQWWRLITAFTYFGSFDFHFVLSIVFTHRFCRLLEESSFAGRRADFVMMFIYGGLLTLGLVYFYFNIIFLGPVFTMIFISVWSRHNPDVIMNALGFLNLRAGIVPIFCLLISWLLGSETLAHLIGIFIGHTYLFLHDEFPYFQRGFHVLWTPRFMRRLFDEVSDDPNYDPLPEDLQEDPDEGDPLPDPQAEDGEVGE